MDILYDDSDKVNLSSDKNQSFTSDIWDEIQAWSNEMYMPFQVAPTSSNMVIPPFLIELMSRKTEAFIIV